MDEQSVTLQMRIARCVKVVQTHDPKFVTDVRRHARGDDEVGTLTMCDQAVDGRGPQLRLQHGPKCEGLPLMQWTGDSDDGVEHGTVDD